MGCDEAIIKLFFLVTTFYFLTLRVVLTTSKCERAFYLSKKHCTRTLMLVFRAICAGGIYCLKNYNAALKNVHPKFSTRTNISTVENNSGYQSSQQYGLQLLIGNRLLSTSYLFFNIAF